PAGPVDSGPAKAEGAPGRGRPLPEPDPVPAGHRVAVGDRVAERHDPHATVRLGLGRPGDPGQRTDREYEAETGRQYPFHRASSYRVKRWLAPPLQVQMSIGVLSAVPCPVTSRHLLTAVLTTVPSA